MLVLGGVPSDSVGIRGIELLDADALLAAANPEPPEDAPLPSDPAVILYTSGTTGPSKPVVVPWVQLQVTAQGAMPYGDLDETDVIYIYYPPSHIGAKAWVHLAAMLGGSVLMRPVFKTDEFVEDVRTYGITTAALVGAMAPFLMSHPEGSDDRSIPLRNIAMAPLLPDLEPFKERFGVRIYGCYSMTELSVPIRGDGWSTENPASAGKAWPDWPYFELRLVDDLDQEVRTDEIGELVVRAGVPWTITPGYFAMDEATVAAWRNGWFHTGDLFRQDTEGNYYFVDRGKDCIRRRGENISSFEVEAAALTHPDVGEAAAVAVPADTNEDEIKLFIVPMAGATIDPAAIVSHLDDQLPRFMVPRYLAVVEDLPKTPTLRIQKHELRARPVHENTWDRLASR